jgi:hypothetical protein
MGGVYRKVEGVVARKILDEVLLVRVSGRLADLQEVLSLNETGAFIWERLDGVADLNSISREVAAAFSVGADESERDVGDFVGGLERDGLVTRSETA